MTTSTEQEASHSERLARVEAGLESLTRETGRLWDAIRDIRAELRDLRTMMSRILLTMVAMWITIIITILLRT